MDALATPSAVAAALKGGKAELESSATTVMPPGELRQASPAYVGGVIIGVAAVIVMVAVGYGARSRIREQINNLGTNMIVITPGAAHQSGVSQRAQAFPLIMLAAIGFSGAVGVFFGYYPARKAAALNPIEALRYE